ncbi:hypothetical protein GEMRC1_001737 [Eukaryota sp. GEM-RC1]
MSTTLESDIQDFLSRNRSNDIDDTDFSLVSQHLESTLNIPEVSQALDTDSFDLRSFISSMQQSLSATELGIAEQLTPHESSFLSMHESLTKASSSLDSVEDFLNKFTDDINILSSEIRQLQDEASQISYKLSNRRSVAPFIRDLYKATFLEQTHVRSLLQPHSFGPSFCSSLRLLSSKISYLSDHNYPCTNQSLVNLSSMRDTAIDNAVKHVLGKFERISKIRFNRFFELQDSELLPLSELMANIGRFEKSVVVVRGYCDLIDEKYSGYLKNVVRSAHRVIQKIQNNSSGMQTEDLSNFGKYLRKNSKILNSETFSTLCSNLVDPNSDEFIKFGRGIYSTNLVSKKASFSNSSSFIHFMNDLLQLITDLITIESSFSFVFLSSNFSEVLSRMNDVISSLFSPFLISSVVNMDVVSLIVSVRLVGLYRNRILSRFQSFYMTDSDVSKVDLGFFDFVCMTSIPRIKSIVTNYCTTITELPRPSTMILSDLIDCTQSPELDHLASLLCLSYWTPSTSVFLCASDQSNVQFLGEICNQIKNAMVFHLQSISTHPYCLEKPFMSPGFLVIGGIYIQQRVSGVPELHNYFEDFVSTNIQLFVSRRLSFSFGALLSFSKKSEVNENSLRAVSSEFENTWIEEIKSIKSDVLSLFTDQSLCCTIMKRIFSKLLISYQKFEKLNTFGIDIISVDKVVAILKSTVGDF